MKVLLVQQFDSRDPRTPIALMDLAAYGRACGHEIDVAYADQVRNFNYDLIAFSAIAFDYYTLPAVKKLREKYGGKIIFGGKAANSLLPEERATLEQLNVETQTGPGEVLFHPGSIDYKNYPLWQEGDFRALDRGKHMTEMMSSRGCPYHCHFCHNTEKLVRFFSPERTVAHASLILDVIGRPRVFLVDDIFAVYPQRMHAILETAHKEKLDLQRRTCFFIHISHTKDDTIQAIKTFNPIEVQVGIESGDNRMLAAMGKMFTSKQAEEQLQKLHSEGIKVACLFLIGFPTETRESLQTTVDFVNRNRKYMSGWWVSYYQPIPFTKGWEMARERVSDDMVTGGWSTEINYLDPNLSIKDLRKARCDVMRY